MSFIEQFKKLNINVKLYFYFTFFQGLGRGIWLGNVLSAYIFYLANESNTILGYTSAAIGMAMTIVVLPSGILADKFRRDYLLKSAFIVGAIGIILTAFATDLLLIFIALIFWGLFQGMIRPSTESLFADSIPSGKRSAIYSWLHLVRQSSMAIGPFVNILLFYYFGNEWEIPILRAVMLIGLLISGFSLVALLIMNDDKSIGDESETIYESDKDGNKNTSTLITVIIIGSNLIIGFGAGMTIKFFPIFFIKIYNLNPIPVNLISGLTFIFTGIASIISQRLSLKRGRVQMMVIVQLIATFCLYIISTYPPIIWLAVLYIARGSLMNASQPLSRSILMDVVAKRHRGKINSIEALAWGLFWNISAALGGVLIDKYDFSFTFQITSAIYFFATLPLLILVPIVKNEYN